MKNFSLVFLVLFLVSFSCKDPFSPEVEAQFKKILVVEGYLNIGDTTYFTLSRTADLKDFEARIPEAGARIEVLEGANTLVEGTSGEDGQCRLATNSLQVGRSYRVRILTKNGKAYQTDILEGKLTPEIDSVSRKIEDEGFKLYISTHDSSNKVKYYAWDFKETWEISTPFVSVLELKNGKVVPRDPDVNLNRCWQEFTSSNILIGSTERLSEARIPMTPITFVPGNSIKIDMLYSILVRQYSHTKEAYQYLENMKKNTEKIGSIFDPQPSELRGNIKCLTDPSEEVIGWVDAGTVTKKRIFIERRERLPRWTYNGLACDFTDVRLDSVALFTLKGYLIRDYTPFDPMKGPPTHARMSIAKCIDCRLMGSNIKPSFWPL